MTLECKGFCNIPENQLATNPVGNTKNRTPYQDHGYCRVCSYWFNKENAWGSRHNRCPCCHGLFSTRPRLCKQRRMWRERQN